MTQDGNVVSITPGSLYLQEINDDETQTLLKNITANLTIQITHITLLYQDSLSANQLLTVGYDVSHFTNPCICSHPLYN